MASTRNRILLAAAKKDRQAVLEHSRKVKLAKGQTLSEAGTVSRHIYFPEVGVVSTIARFGDGRFVEMATTGKEGCVGAHALIDGTDKELATHLVQVEGEGLAMPREELTRLRRSNPEFSNLLARYAQAFLYQILVSGGCNGLHTVEQRLVRWLLQMHDRCDRGDMQLTHEFLAEMLGVRRASITIAARTLQKRKLIQYHRGVVRVIDRPKLENATCECYHLVQVAYEELVPMADQ